MLVDATAILRECLQLKLRLKHFQLELVAGLSLVDRVVSLATPGVEPEVYVSILNELEEESSQALPASTVFENPKRFVEHRYSIAYSASSRRASSRHGANRGIISESNVLNPPPSVLFAEVNELLPSIPSSLSNTQDFGIKSPNESIKLPDITQLAPAPLIDSGVRWDNEDYQGDSNGKLTVSAANESLRRSKTMADKSVKMKSMRGNPTANSRPLTWVPSFKLSKAGLPTTKTGSKPEASSLGSFKNIAAGVESVMTGITNALPNFSVKSLTEQNNSLPNLAGSDEILPISPPVVMQEEFMFSRSNSNGGRGRMSRQQGSIRQSTASRPHTGKNTSIPPFQTQSALDHQKLDKVVGEGPVASDKMQMSVDTVKGISTALESSQKLTTTKKGWSALREAVVESTLLVETMKEQNDRQRKGSLFEDEQLPSEDSTSKKEKPGSPLMRMAEPTQDYEVVTTPFHGWFICKAFDEKGRRIPYEFREADTHGQISFWKSGFHPMSMFGAFSTTISIVVYFFTLLMELYFASYVPEVRSYAGISWAISLLFLLETIVNFLSPQARGNVHYEGARYNLKDWCTHYLKSKLILDFVSMVPWVQLIVLPDYAFPLSLLRLLRFNKLPKMMSHNPLLLQFITGIESIGGIGAILSRIIPMGVVFIIFLHFQACFLYYVGQLNRFSTWSEQFDHWRFFPGGIEAASTQDRYLWVLSMSIGNVFQMTFKPQTSLEQSTTLVFIIFGAILYALLVGLLSSAAVAYDASGRLYRQKIDELTEYLNWKKIDGVTKRKVISYYEYKYRGKYFEEQQLLADMNNSLKMELAIITCRRLIEKVPFLKREVSDGRDDIYIGKISTALQAVHYVTGDFIFHQGEIGTDMFFIQTGAVNILTNGRFITNLKDGSFFGEVALIANVPRTASIQAATNCTLYRLNSSDFNAIIVEFEDMKIRVDQIYKDRMIKIQQASKQKGKGISKMM